MKVTSLINSSNLIKQFVSSTLNVDILAIEDLLAVEGKYEIVNDQLKVIEVGKKEYLKWYEDQLKTTQKIEYSYDQCIGCSFGNQVVLFNNGTFPKKPNDITERTKAGLMIEGNDGKISKIIFCFIFLKTENKYACECFGEEVVKNVKKGMTEEEAIEEYENNPNSEYRHLIRKANEDFENSLNSEYDHFILDEDECGDEEEKECERPF